MGLNFLNIKTNDISDFKLNNEAADYNGCSYQFNGKKIIHRLAKITPTKIGQFVTLWKRDESGVTCPLSLEDDFDFLIIACQFKDLVGRFLIPKSSLADLGYIKSLKKTGKRGFRVYPTWDKPTSKQAIKSQKNQLVFFKQTAVINVEEVC